MRFIVWVTYGATGMKSENLEKKVRSHNKVPFARAEQLWHIACMLSALWACAIARLSVRRSVRQRVYHTKTVEVRIMKFLSYSSSCGGSFIQKCSGVPRAGASNKDGWENQPFSSFKRRYMYLENGSRYGRSYY